MYNVQAVNGSDANLAAKLENGLNQSAIRQMNEKKDDFLTQYYPTVQWQGWKVDGNRVIPSGEVYIEKQQENIFEKGDGTRENPYVIVNIEQFMKFAGSFNEAKDYAGEYIVLDQDIVLPDGEFNPLGQTENGYVPFCGNFNGQGHKIANLRIGSRDAYKADDYQMYYGLFSELGQDAVVSDLVIEDAQIYVEGDASIMAGILAGSVRNATIDGCQTSGNVGVRTVNSSEALTGANSFAGGIAGYEVYAAEDIFTADMQKDADGNRTKYYSEGELVATLVTGDDGKAVLKNLPLGKYKVVEVEAPYGYVLNQDAQYVTFAYVDDHTPVIYETATFTNDRQKLSLSVEKKDSETDEPINGAVFGLYADEDIRNVEGKVIIEAGTLLETAVSDENGIVSFTKDYPFAKYYAKEMETPAGYVTNEEVIAFDAQYQGQDIKVAKYSSLFLNTPTTFEFSKEDITSGAELSGATLCVIDKDGNIIETWTSVSGEKHVIKKLVVGETYTLREEFAPYGYLRATDIQFTVEDTENIQSVVMKDEVPTGSIIINKDSEFVTDKTLIKGHWYDFIFNYFKKSLAGVTFEVYAAEDIVSPDGLDTVYFEKDELVATIVTDDNGIASIEELPLGKYYLVETATIEGFVLDSTPIEADLSYVDQDTEVVYTRFLKE